MTDAFPPTVGLSIGIDIDSWVPQCLSTLSSPLQTAADDMPT